MPAGIRRPGIQRPIVQIDDLVPTHSRASSFPINPGPDPKTRHGELWFRSAGSPPAAPFSLHKKMAPSFEAEFVTPLCASFHCAIGASITDAACPEDQATARCFDALAHDAATGAAIRIIAVG